MDFLHETLPNAVAFTLGNISISWYGLCLSLGMLSAYFITYLLSRKRNIPLGRLTDLLLLTAFLGFIGARLYHVLNEPVYYWQHPGDIFQIWQGGLAIHGGILVGLLVLYYGARRLQLPLLRLTDLLAPGVLLGLSIGRWGNYFNQELFGRPTSLPWGIPIAESLRPESYINASYFHPVFLYESLIDLFGVVLLLGFIWLERKRQNDTAIGVVTALFFLLYGVGRFAAELFRFDATPHIIGIRLPLIVSALFILLGFWMLIRISQKRYPLPVRPEHSTLKSDANPRPNYPRSHQG
ncbi:MAG: prolipoprotein diacylglyceryl transferase [Candidatus Nomurabacteria bacterium]|nr:MAG: prolipoprotein diacylglyceryl transferase [Candidatus Nomurabacteria bacterium]